MTSYTISIENWNIPSVNKLLGSHWRKAGRIKSGAVQMIHAYSRHIPRAQGKRMVQITHKQPKGRLPDPDNLLKVGHDALKTIGLIRDDSTDFLDFGKPHVSYGKKHTTITITEVA